MSLRPRIAASATRPIAALAVPAGGGGGGGGGPPTGGGGGGGGAPRRIAALAVAAGVVGCGGGGSRSDVRAVSDGFLQALGQHDDVAACRALSDQARSQLEDDAGKLCAQAIGGLGVEPST